MARIYSRRLAAGAFLANTATVVYTCPAGVTAVVRDVSALPYVAGATAFYLVLNAAVTPLSFIGAVAFLSQHYKGRIILTAGETLKVVTVGSAWEVVICGYELAP